MAQPGGAQPPDDNMRAARVAMLDKLPDCSLKDLPQDALCCICYSATLDNVTLCTSSHNACRGCADKYVESSSRYAKCPIGCPKMHLVDSRWIENKGINSIVENATIYCPNAEAGCCEKLKLDTVREHAAKCEWREIACKCSSCPWKGPVCKWHDHMEAVNHGRHLVDMLLFTQQTCLTMDDNYTKLENEVREYKQAVDGTKTQLSAIGQCVNTLTTTVNVIDGNTKKPGDSARTHRRERKTAKDVTALEEQATKTANAHADAMQAAQTELNDAVRLRDLYFRERDEARAVKRERGIEADFFSDMVHDQHVMMKRNFPDAVARQCACRKCSPERTDRVVKQRYREGFTEDA